MPTEIWSGWVFQREHADRALVSILRRGTVPRRGRAYQNNRGPPNFFLHESRFPQVYFTPIVFDDVVGHLLSIRLSSSQTVAEYEGEPFSHFQGMMPTRPKLYALLVNDEVAWEPFRDEAIERELPADATPEISGARTDKTERNAGTKVIAWEIAEGILADDTRRPPRGFGRLMALARLVNAELGRRGHQYETDSVRKMIGRDLREWEAKHPDE
jgi:hypothetical protein